MSEFLIPKITMTLIEKIGNETAAEIKRVEDYLNSLRKLQVAIDPQPKKRKYTKRKKALTPKPVFAEIRTGVPIYSKGYNTNYEITRIKNTKNSRSKRKKVV